MTNTTTPFEEVARNMDVVFDTVGGETFQRAFITLKAGGFLVTAVAFPNEAVQHGIRVARVQCKANAGQLESISELVVADKLQAHIAQVFPFPKINAAFELSESGRTRGKIVLQISK